MPLTVDVPIVRLALTHEVEGYEIVADPIVGPSRVSLRRLSTPPSDSRPLILRNQPFSPRPLPARNGSHAKNADNVPAILAPRRLPPPPARDQY